MARRHHKELAFVGGELVTWLLRNLGCAIMSPDKLPGNPFEEKAPESEAMKAHREKWARDQWRGMVDASKQ